MFANPFTSLKRITSGSSWIPEIDGLRFVAIASVVLYHLSGELYSRSGYTFTLKSWYLPVFHVIAQGHLGVQLFFVISGFILGRPFARHYLLGDKPVSLRSYFLRRVTRLEPPYVLNLLLLALAIHLYAHISWRDLLPHLAASAAYVHGLVYRSISPLSPVAWTLEIEVQFYLLVPLLTLLFRIPHRLLRRAILLSSVIGVGLLQQYVLFRLPYTSWLWETIIMHLQFFLAGLLLSDLYILDLERWPSSWLWDVLSLVLWPLFFVAAGPWGYPLLPVIVLLCYMGAFRGYVFRRFFRTPWVAITGGMCYSMYLWHFFIIALVFKATRHLIFGRDLMLNLAIQSAVVLPCVLLGTVVYFALVERPCMDPRWPQKLKAALGSRQKRLPVT